MANDHTKAWSTPLVIREIQIQTTTRAIILMLKPTRHGKIPGCIQEVLADTWLSRRCQMVPPFAKQFGGPFNVKHISHMSYLALIVNVAQPGVIEKETFH